MKTFATSGAPHTPATNTVQKVMGKVLIALVPGVIAHCYYFGPGVLIQIGLATIFALGFEAAMLRLRGRKLQPYISDLSAPVTAVLFALCIPPLAPWWVSLIAMATAMVFAKHLYGGLGFNLFNPAMVGYAVVLIAFTRELSLWLPPQNMGIDPLPWSVIAQAIFSGQLPITYSWDTLAQATPLDTLRMLTAQGQMISEIRHNPLFGDFGGRGWEWIANWYALGGIYLVWQRVISWHIPVAVLATVIAITLPVFLSDPDVNPLPLVHVFSGGMMLAAFFIATDPVSGCATPRGRILFGVGVAAFTLIIRRWGSYPDGIAFAVLLMNSAAPLLDRYTKPRVFGQ